MYTENQTLTIKKKQCCQSVENYFFRNVGHNKIVTLPRMSREQKKKVLTQNFPNASGFWNLAKNALLNTTKTNFYDFYKYPKTSFKIYLKLAELLGYAIL